MRHSLIKAVMKEGRENEWLNADNILAGEVRKWTAGDSSQDYTHRN